VEHFRLDLLDQRYRFLTVYSYVIAYRWEAQPIEIIAVIHGARNLRAFLRERDK
jgi:plasmid stabilization system protein ParE